MREGRKEGVMKRVRSTDGSKAGVLTSPFLPPSLRPAVGF
jgi:hypothetical protein